MELKLDSRESQLIITALDLAASSLMTKIVAAVQADAAAKQIVQQAEAEKKEPK